MEYCSHIWGGAPKTGSIDLLDRVQKRIVNLIGPEVSVGLPFAQEKCSQFYKYYHAKCSAELADLVPPRRVNVRTTRFSERLHKYAVHSPLCKRNFYQFNFFPRTASLWNSLPPDCFPPQYNIGVFKSRVNRVLLHTNHQLLTIQWPLALFGATCIKNKKIKKRILRSLAIGKNWR